MSLGYCGMYLCFKLGSVALFNALKIWIVICVIVLSFFLSHDLNLGQECCPSFLFVCSVSLLVLRVDSYYNYL